MKIVLMSVFILAAVRLHGQIVDQVCQNEYCERLTISGNSVWYSQTVPASRVLIGRYLKVRHPPIPATEAAVLVLRSLGGWSVVASAFLHHDALNEGEPAIRLRFWSASGRLTTTHDVLAKIEDRKIGRLFGGNDEIFAINSWEEHVYNTLIELWFLPTVGDPKLLLNAQGTFKKFSEGGPQEDPGVTILRETYDGVHADTKRYTEEFYIWNSESKTLNLRAK